MSAIDTDEFRKLLQEERAKLLASADYLHSDSAQTMDDKVGEVAGGGTDNHLGDMASVTFDRELDDGLEEGAQDTIRQIDAALQRIEDGTYGICAVCGKPIGEERLRAIPWATLCIDDQRTASGR